MSFLIPASQFVQLRVVGNLYASDFLSLVALVLSTGSSASVLNRRLPRRFLTFGLIWLLAQAVTDLIRATPFEDYVRGWGMIGFTLVNFAALYKLLSESRRRIMLCAFGFVAGDFLTYFFSPSQFAAEWPWKFGYGYAVTMLIVLLAALLSRRRRPALAFAAMMGATTLNLYEVFRSLAGECFIAGAYLPLMRLINSPRKKVAEPSRVQALLAFALLGVVAAGLFRIYTYCASNGLLGQAAEQTYAIQASGRYGVLVGGRGDFLTGLEAAIDSPIIGHGAWAKDWHYGSRSQDLLLQLGYQFRSPWSDSWLIPSHSYLVGAWVDTGIVGALFWLWVLSLPLRVMSRPHTVDEPLTPLVAFLAAGLIWDVLFSPFGAAQRFTASFEVVTLMWFLESASGTGDLATLPRQ